MTNDLDDLEEQTRDDINAGEAEEREDEELAEDEPLDSENIDLEEVGDLDDIGDDGELSVVEEELSQREQNAKSLAIRRAIEQRMDRKRLEEDLDYLDLDLED